MRYMMYILHDVSIFEYMLLIVRLYECKCRGDINNRGLDIRFHLYIHHNTYINNLWMQLFITKEH